MWLQEKLSKGCHTTALASAFVPAVQGLCYVGGNTQVWICLSPRGDRSCTWLSVQPVPSGGTGCRQYTLGIWLWDALLQVLGCPSCIWGLDCLIKGSRVSVGYCWFSCYWGGGGSRVERQRLRQCQDPSTSFMSKPERQALTSVLKGTAGELALLHSITCGGSEGCWIDHEVPCTKDPPALKGSPFFLVGGGGMWWPLR